MTDRPQTIISWLQEWLPRGLGLNEKEWRKRHRVLVILLWLHAFGLPVVGMFFGHPLFDSMASGAAIGCFALLAGIERVPHRGRSALAGVGLALSSSALVHLSGGYTEMHFHYFVVLPLLMLYHDWIPFLISAAFVGLHHAVIGTMFPHSVYNHPDALAHPWVWAGVHVAFFIAASMVYLFTWRNVERTNEALWANEEQLQALLDNSPSLIFIKDPDGRYLKVNREFERALRRTGAEIIGKTDRDLFPAESAAPIRMNDEQVVRDRMPLLCEEMVFLDGSPHTSIVSKYPLLDRNGTLYAIGGIATDITARKKVEEQLRQSEFFLDSIVEHLPSMVFVKDAKDLRFVRINTAGESLIGHPRETILGKNDYDFFPKEQADFFTAKDRAVFEGRLLLDIPEEPIQTADNGLRYLHTKKIPLYSADGDPQYLIGISEDITEQREAERKERAQHQLAELSADLHATLLMDLPLDLILQHCTDILVRRFEAAFARIWLLGPGDLCQACHKSAQCANRNQCLHLAASSGLSRNLNGEFRRVPLGAYKIGRIAQGWGAVHSNDVLNDDRMPNKDWMRENGLVSFMGQPLRIGERLHGVMMIFSRSPLHAPELAAFELATKTVCLGIERKQVEQALRESEARYRALFEKSKDAKMTLTPPTWQFTSANPATLTLFHVPDEPTFCSLGPWDLSPERQPDGRLSADKAAEMIEIAMSEGSHFFEWRHRRRTGEEFPATVLLTRLELNGIALIQATVRDITDQKQAEDALRLSEARFRQVVEAAPNGIVMVDRAGVITLVNAQVEHLFGHDRDALLGQSISQLLPHRFRTQHPSDMRGFFTNPSPRAMGRGRDLFGLRQDGTEFPIEIGLTPVETSNGLQVLASIIDITERKTAERELHARQALLETANKELEAFSYSVSHDLRSPLRAIDGFSQALLEDYTGRLDATGQDYLHRVRNATQRMGRLIDDLLTLSRATRKPFHREHIDLSALAETVAADLRQSDPDRNVHVSVAPAMTADGDAGLLRIALENLLGNAWKFTGPRTDARIEMGAMVESGIPTYFVRDNGVGFDMAYADKLFAPFQRLHGMAEFPGTGIGLATVSRIIQRHGGRIWIEGKTDQGATVFFTLSHPPAI